MRSSWPSAPSRSRIARCSPRARSTRVLGHARRALGDFAGAVEAFELGEAAAAERGLEPYRLELVMLRAATLTDLGGLDEARRLALEAHRQAASIGSDVNDLWARIVEGFVLLRSDPAAATAVFEVVLRDEADHRWPGGEAAARQGIASAQLLEGDLAGAADSLTGLLELLAAQGAQSDLRSILHLAGALLLARGRPRAAADLAATGLTLPNVSSFVRTTEELFPIPVEDGHVLAPSAALRLALRMVRAEGAPTSRTVDDGESPSFGAPATSGPSGTREGPSTSRRRRDWTTWRGSWPSPDERSTSWTSSGLRWRSPAPGRCSTGTGAAGWRIGSASCRRSSTTPTPPTTSLARSRPPPSSTPSSTTWPRRWAWVAVSARAPAPPSGPGRP